VTKSLTIHGLAWNDPKHETFPIPPEVLQAQNTV